MSTNSNKFGGMTVNERLYVSGLMDDFDKAIEEKNLEKAMEILSAIEIGDENVEVLLVKYGLK